MTSLLSFFSGGTTFETKNINLSDIPSMQSLQGTSVKPDDAIIFNTGVVDYRCIPGLRKGDVPLFSISLVAPGYKTQTAQTVTTGVSHDSKKQIAKGCTFALDSQCFQDAALHVKLISGDRMLLERTIPTKSLQYTGQSFFTSTLHFGGINMQGTAKNNTPVPTITMAFELLAQGNGKYFKRTTPRFVLVEVAKLEDELVASSRHAAHPLAHAVVA
jgi:hypothetical protein